MWWEMYRQCLLCRKCCSARASGWPAVEIFRHSLGQVQGALRILTMLGLSRAGSTAQSRADKA